MAEDDLDVSTVSQDRKVMAFWAGIVVLGGLIVYSNSFYGPFIFDDSASIPANLTIRDLGNLRQMLNPPAAGETVTGRPLLNVSFAINWRIFGSSVFGYHITNLTIHLLAGLVLFGIIRRTLTLPSMRLDFADSADLFAATVAGLWILHPLQTESVTYIVQRAESLAGLMYLLTLYCFIRALRTGYRWVWLGASVLCCTMGVGIKETLVSAPLIVLLFDRAFVAKSFRTALIGRWKYYSLLTSTWLLLGYLVFKAGSRGGTALTGPNIDPISYLRTQFFAIAHYLRLAVWPNPLVLDYGTNVVMSFREIKSQTALIALLLTATLMALWRFPKLGFIGAWFFLTLAPSSSFIPVVTQTIAEHRMYLPLAAIIMTAALLVGWVAGAFNSEMLNTAIGLAIIALATALGATTYRRNATYASELSIWQDTASKNPMNTRAQMGVGLALLALHTPVKAMPYFEKAVEINPANPKAFNNRALAHFDLGQYQMAVDDDTRSLQLDPENPRALNNRGIAHYALGNYSLAIDDFSASLQLRPNDGGTHINRAMARYAIKDYTQARDDIAKASELGIEADPASFPDLFLKRDASKTPGRGGP